MTKAISITLSEHWANFIERRVEQGHYASASEVVRAGLQLLEAEERRRQALRQAIDEGEASGRAEPFDIEAFLARMHAGRSWRIAPSTAP